MRESWLGITVGWGCCWGCSPVDSLSLPEDCWNVYVLVTIIANKNGSK